MKNVLKLCQGRLCVATIEQIGAAALADVAPKYIEDVVTEYEKRRNIVHDALSKIEGVVCEKPRGAFYIMAKLPVDNSETFAKWLLTDFDVDGATVMFAPGEGFYATEGLGRDEIRISYVLEENSLKTAMSILEKGIKAYNAR